VTTVTSSDRGDTGSTRSQRGARSNASDIPGQRAGGAAGAQTLRILVLGGSAAADELRRQAADAGAELAQRFSARVTHVVTEPGLSADDARVAKALAADLPVLTVDECAQLMGFCADPATASAVIPNQPDASPKKRAAGAKSTPGDDDAKSVAKGKGGVGAEKAKTKAKVTPGAAEGEAIAVEAEGEAKRSGDAKAETEEPTETEKPAEPARAEFEAEAAMSAAGATEVDAGTQPKARAKQQQKSKAKAEVAAEQAEVGAEEESVAADVLAEESFSGTEQLVAAAAVEAAAELREGEAGVAGVGQSSYSPMESALGSALEGALSFQPLAISGGELLAFGTDYLSTDYPAVSRSVQQIDRDAQVGQSGYVGRTAEVGSGGSGGGGGVSVQVEQAGRVGTGDEADDEVEGEAKVGSTDVGRGEVEVAVEVEVENVIGFDSAGDGELIDLVDLIDLGSLDDLADRDEVVDGDWHARRVDPGAERARTVASYAWAAIPFASLGLLTPVAMGYAAYRQRSRALAGVAAWYLFAVTIAFAISATAHSGTRPQSAVGVLLTICLAASWIGGTVHALMIRRQVFGRAGRTERAGRAGRAE
jgi:hypothetical protein